MGPSEGVCISCHKGGTLNCTGVCSSCTSKMAGSWRDSAERYQRHEEAQRESRESDSVLTAGQRLAERRTTITPAEKATVLAALTFWRQCRLVDVDNRPPAIHQIATNGGTLPTITEEKLRDMIQRIDGSSIIMVDDAAALSMLGTRCGLCGEDQYATPAGPTCANGHGGTLPLRPGEVPELHKVQYKESGQDG